MTIDTRDIYDLGPVKFRTQADRDTEQICYYNRNKIDTSFNFLLAVRKETLSAGKITFSIVKVIDKTNRHDTIYCQISDELNDFKNDIIQQTIQQTSESDLVRKTIDKRSDRWWLEHGWTSQEKARISFKIIIRSERNIPPRELNIGTFYLILLMLKLTRKIFIRIISLLMPTSSLQRI